MALVWGGAATAAACFGCRQAEAWPALASSRQWLREQRDLGPRYAVEGVAHRSGAWLAVGAVGAIAGLPAAAALRGASLLVTGPIEPAVPRRRVRIRAEVVRLFKSSPHRLPRMVSRLSVAVTVLPASWCTVILALSGTIGLPLLGETWPLAKPLLLTMPLFALAQAMAIGPAQGLWGLGAASRSLRTQLVNVLLMVATMSGGAAIDGARGAAVGLVGTAAVSMLIWWAQFRRAFTQAIQITTTSAAESASRSAEPPTSDPPLPVSVLGADGNPSSAIGSNGANLVRAIGDRFILRCAGKKPGFCRHTEHVLRSFPRDEGGSAFRRRGARKFAKMCDAPNPARLHPGPRVRFPVQRELLRTRPPRVHAGAGSPPA